MLDLVDAAPMRVRIPLDLAVTPPVLDAETDAGADLPAEQFWHVCRLTAEDALVQSRVGARSLAA